MVKLVNTPGLVAQCLTLGGMLVGCTGAGDIDLTDAHMDMAGDVEADTAIDSPVDTPLDTTGDPAGDGGEDAIEDPGEDTATDTAGDADDVDGDPGCLPGATPTGSQGHNAGMDCLSCHQSMSGPLAFTLAGTLFSDGSGSAPVPGATVVITDSGGGRVDLVTHENGNFYTASTIEFPVTVDASKCPDHASMLSPVTLGGCNSCHGSSFRIHIP